MAISKEKKEQIIKSLEDVFSKSKTIVFVKFSGISAEELAEIRRDLNNEEVQFKVAKKTLMSRAFNTIFKKSLPKLDGEIGVAYGNDEINPARLIGTQIRKFKDLISIEGGVFNSKPVDAEYMRGISVIPDLQTLRGQFVGLLMSPIRSFVVASSEIANKK